MELRINEDFKRLIPALTAEEFQQLETNILAEGIRDPLVVWNGFIVDGHNRYEVAMKYDIDFSIIEKRFDSENQVKEWMILNQFGRRNINNYQRSVLALQLEGVFREKAKANLKIYGGNQHENAPCQISDNFQPIDTKKELAKIANVSHDTISKVKTIEESASDEVKEKLSAGEISINQAYNEVKSIETKRQKSLDSEGINEDEDGPCVGPPLVVDLTCSNNEFIMMKQAEYAKRGYVKPSKERVINSYLAELRELKEARK